MKDLFSRYIQPGRLCVIQFGSDEGKLCFIVDIINNNRVMIDGGSATGVTRQVMPIGRLALTDFTIKIGRGSTTSYVQKVAKESQIVDNFFNTQWGKKMIKKQKKAQMGDFERFKLGMIKNKWNKIAKNMAIKN